ncbi:MAG: hypothetical protein VCA55_05590 [Verrucomicrobiales bacterium]
MFSFIKSPVIVSLISITVLAESALGSPFFSQRVPDHPRDQDGSIASAVVYDFFGRAVAQRCADNVILSASKVARSVSWWGKFKDNDAPESIRFHIAFYGDNNGVPNRGDVLSSTDVTFTKLNDTGDDFGVNPWRPGEDIYVFRANITPLTIRRGAQVWFSVLGDSGEESGSFGWRFQQADTISACDVQDLDRDISEMIFDWTDGGSGGIGPNNFSFVLDDEFISVPIPEIETFSNIDGSFSLTVLTEADTLYQVEASGDLKQWGTIGEFQGTGNPVTFTDLREAIFKQQFYRVRLAE